MKSKTLAILLILVGTASLHAGGLSKRYKNWTKTPESYFMTNSEKAAWKTLKTDDEADKFITEYKAKRGEAFFKSLEPNIAAADKYFSVGEVKGSETLRGKVIIMFGPPSAIDQSKGGAAGSNSNVNSSIAGADSRGGGAGVAIGGSAGGGGNALSAPPPNVKVPTFSLIYDEQAAPKAIGKKFRVELNMISNSEQEPADPQDLDQKFEAVAEASIQKPNG